MPQRSAPHIVTPEGFAERIETETRHLLRYLDLSRGDELLVDLGDRTLTLLEKLRHHEARRAALLTEATQAADYDELARCERELTALEIARFREIASVPALHRHCTDHRDLLAARTMTLVAAEMVERGHGAPPAPHALISMGSDGREEQTLITDQDYLLVYGDGEASHDGYFRLFAEILVERLAEVGFKKCDGNIMPSNPIWRGSLQQWHRRLLAIVRYEFEDYAKNLMDLIVLSDARYVAGERELAEQLIEMIRDFEQNYFQVIWGMARAATEMKVGLGWFKRLWVEPKGEFKGLFNVKLLGWAPLVMNVRILAVNLALPATSTLERLRLLAEAKSLAPATAAGLREAYHLLTRLRIELQIRCLRGEQGESHHLDPQHLSSEERTQLREGLLAIEELQKMIHTNFAIL